MYIAIIASTARYLVKEFNMYQCPIWVAQIKTKDVDELNNLFVRPEQVQGQPKYMYTASES